MMEVTCSNVEITAELPIVSLCLVFFFRFLGDPSISVDFCNDNDLFFTRGCDGLKCVVENDRSIGRTKVCR